MSRTEQSFAYNVTVGDVIVCSNGDSITVESIHSDTDGNVMFTGPQISYLTFAGTQTSHTHTGTTARPNGLYGAFADEPITILSK